MSNNLHNDLNHLPIVAQSLIRDLLKESFLTIELAFSLAAVTFVGFTFIAFYYSDMKRVRKAYITYLLVGIVIVSIVGVELLPFVHLHKFIDSPDPVDSNTEVRLFDEDGNEIVYDARASPPLTEPMTGRLARYSLEKNPSSKGEFFDHLLLNACEFRNEGIETGTRSTVEGSFPPHHFDYKWNTAELANFGDIEGIVVYTVTIESSSDGREVISREEERQFERSVAEASEEVQAACS
ncbi:hypothetical protein [Natronosalvus vescus]|uniref:hypothetical protein n=1 Tax=Natronosalvus vescus TaxID=2953881 RepID=UPI002090BE6E|nr:hypothetical protein [Natronosalvus vescus]